MTRYFDDIISRFMWTWYFKNDTFINTHEEIYRSPFNIYCLPFNISISDIYESNICTPSALGHESTISPGVHLPPIYYVRSLEASQKTSEYNIRSPVPEHETPPSYEEAISMNPVWILSFIFCAIIMCRLSCRTHNLISTLDIGYFQKVL